MPENPTDPAANVPDRKGEGPIQDSAGWVLDHPTAPPIAPPIAPPASPPTAPPPSQWSAPGITPPPPPTATVQPSSARPWIIALIIVSVFALVVSIFALFVGGLALSGAAGGGSGSDAGYNVPTSSFGQGAVYGEYVGSLDFTGVRSGDGLNNGTCFTVEDLDAENVGEVSPLSCDDPHEQEAYARTTIPGDEFPGYDTISDQVHDTCQGAFSDYIGADYQDSDADFGGLAPTKRGWAEGQRDIVCFTFLYENERTGSLHRSGL